MVWFWATYSTLAALLVLAVVVDAHFGLPTVADVRSPRWDRRTVAGRQRLSVIVPARNEEAGIGACLRSLAAQDVEDLEIIAVDDRSTDRTPRIMAEVAAASDRVRVLHVRALPAGWLGKTHAMWVAAARASGDWLLFTDGDVVFRSDALRRALSYAEHEQAAHLVVFPTFLTRTVGERMVISSFQLSFLAARPWKVRDPASWAHIGTGAFNLVRRDAYEAIGTFAALRLVVVEDVMLGRRLKQAGLPARAAFAPGLINVHWAPGAVGLLHNMSKSIYALLGFRWYLALALAAVTVAIHIAPFALVWIAPGWTKLGFAICLGGLLRIYYQLRPLNGIAPGYFLLHPVSSALTVYAVLRSLLVTTTRGSVRWRDTEYSLDELRRATARQSQRPA